MRKKMLLAITTVMLLDFVLALCLPREIGWVGAALTAVPYIWLSLFWYANVVWDGGKREKHSAE